MSPGYSLKRARRYLVVLALACAQAPAHDFWLQPEAFRMERGARSPMTLQVGHGPARQRSPIPLQRIERFDAIAPDGRAIGLHGRLHPGRADSDADLRFDAPGTYVLVFETDDHAHSRLPALRFNDYLESEGLTPAIEQRRRTQHIDVDGSEIYSRVAKAIVQVGEGAVSPAGPATAPLGLTLEIVPERNPYAEPRPARLPVRVIYHGQPLAGARVKLTRLEDDAQPVEVQQTDASGRATFALPSGGSWLLNVVWTRPSPAGSDADFETTFSSLSFGEARDAAP